MDDDWDVEDTPVNSGSSNPTPPVAAVAPPPVRATQRKFADEDQEDDDDDDWDKSDDDKPKAKAGAPAAAPVKKKMTLKQKLAEKERLAQEKLANGDDEDELIPSMTEQDRRRMARERELEADLEVANELLGASSLNDASAPGSGTATPSTLSILSSKPKTKDEFTTLAHQIALEITSRHTSNPLYPHFAEALSKELCEALNAVQTRKISSALSVLGNTKQAEERDKASGKKKVTGKPKLGGAKTINKVDTDAYDDVLDDDDFM